MIKRIMMFVLVAGMLTACGSKVEEAEKTNEVVVEETLALEEAVEAEEGSVVIEETEAVEENLAKEAETTEAK